MKIFCATFWKENSDCSKNNFFAYTWLSSCGFHNAYTGCPRS